MDESTDQSVTPFRPLHWLAHRRHRSDRDYIETLRGSVRGWDRWRWVGVALNVSMVGGVLYLAQYAVKFLKVMQQHIIGANADPEMMVLLGLALGFQLGILLHTALWGTIMGLTGLRSERLLVKYYDTYGDSILREGIGSKTERHEEETS